MSNMSKDDMVRFTALRLKSVTMRMLFRQGAAQYLGIPMEVSDADALDIVARAIVSLEGKI